MKIFHLPLSSRLFWLVCCGGLVLAGMAGWWYMNQRQEPDLYLSQAEAKQLQIAQNSDGDAIRLPATNAQGTLTGDVIFGDFNAPVTIIEYASLTCSHCARFHQDSWPSIKRDYIDTGKAKLVFREFPLDSISAYGSILARCGGERRYAAIIDLLFKRQGEWNRLPQIDRMRANLQSALGRAPDQDEINAAYRTILESNLLKIGKITGLSAKQFTACTQNQEILNAISTNYKIGQNHHKVSATPTFIINGEKHAGTLTFVAMSKIIDRFLQN